MTLALTFAAGAVVGSAVIVFIVALFHGRRSDLDRDWQTYDTAIHIDTHDGRWN